MINKRQNIKVQAKFDFFMDPGHGWVKVPKTLLKQLGIESKISSYSYQQGEYAYLEEDCDAGEFIVAYKKKFADLPKFNERVSNKSSRVRNYESYCA